jgi:hypothetical protein
MIFRKPPFSPAAKTGPIAIPLDQATVMRIVELFRAAERAMNEGRSHIQQPVDYTGLVSRLHERVGAAVARGGDDAPVPLLFDSEFPEIESAIRSLRCDGSLRVPGAHEAARAGQELLDELHLRRGYAVATISSGGQTVHVFPRRLIGKGTPPRS